MTTTRWRACISKKELESSESTARHTSRFVSRTGIDTPGVEVPQREFLRPTAKTYLVEVDDRLPKLVVQFVEISHANFPKVTRMVLVEICSVMMLSTGHTTSTRMLSMLANTAVAGRDVAPATRLMSINALPRLLDGLYQRGALAVYVLLACLRQPSRHCYVCWEEN